MKLGDTLTIDNKEWTVVLIGKTYATLILKGTEGYQRIIKIKEYENNP